MSSSKSDQIDGGDLKRVDSFQWPSGHVGHLSEGQQGALDKFKELCTQKGYYHPGEGKTPPSHDDETLLRYLRARKFIPQDAFGQFKDTEDWRQENDLDNLYETIDIDEYEQTRRLYPQWTGRRDKRGIPFYVFEVAHLDPKEVTAYQNDKDRKKNDGGPDIRSKVPRKMLRLFALYENLCRFVLPLCSAIPDRPSAETPVSQSSNVVDISKVGFKTFWNLRAHLQDSSRLATAHYPETLDRIFVVGAPSFFPTVWEWAKRWFDPITVQKISILSNANTLSTLEKFVHIDNIPKKYGGNLDWAFGDMPALEPALADSLRWKEEIRQKGHRTFPIGPIKWQYDDDGDLVAVAIGTQNGAPREKVIAGLHPEADVARLALSPGRNPHSALFASVSGAGATTLHQTLSKEATKGTAANGSANPATKATMTPNPELDVGKSPNAALQETSRAGTFTVPYRDHENEVASPPIGAREGTSSTRFEQQSNTHADGTLAEGTPHVRQDGQGTEHSVMEPRTVGQAPKETPLYREDDSAPTMVEQAQQLAGQAVETAKAVPAMALNAVGMGGKKEETKTEESKPEDPRIDGMESKNVEEFMRSKTMSQPEQAR
ncbi:hypothetical protein PRZ48_011915 [Zasmidium cellare]|uniref:CRAL-TRIO domain-containing protein n=1 Tax=Zasmidium cellare TaxID=395010 RepID=A0ABR0E7Q7_ZASCE|nr:hypothetical protein PRZ48_011915 [Zasmidium cellare]